jgi:hypothetical protein
LGKGENMKLLKMANRKRLESIEAYLGLFYTDDGYGGKEHKMEQDGYGVTQRLDKRLKNVEKLPIIKQSKEKK